MVEKIDDEEDESDEEDEDEDDVGEMQALPTKTVVRGARRVSVSASVMDVSAAAARKVPFFAKSGEENAKITECMRANPFFSALDKKAFAQIVGAFEHCDFADGDTIIKEGDFKAEHFFLLDEGTAEAFKGETSVKKYGHADSFGELALLYNQPRAATVKATSGSNGWKLEQQAFKDIIVAGVMAKRAKYSNFLRKCVLFKSLKDNEIALLADSMKEVEFDAEKDVITQGEKANAFYIVEEGSVKCFKDGKEVGQLEEGQYFGEIALMYDVDRQATVRACGAVKVLEMARKTFQNLLGPLSDILQRDMEKYDNMDAIMMTQAAVQGTK